MKEPRFIVLEGPEGAGKSTQIRMLRDRLIAAGRTVVCVRDPGSTPIGERIRAILLDVACAEMSLRTEMLLYMAARAQMMAELIEPALQSGATVVCDRFVASTLAYQGDAEELSEADIRTVADVAIGGRWPDCVVLLDMPPEKSLARVKRQKDRIEQRPLVYHQRVRQRYLALAQSEPGRFHVVNADQAPEQVATDIWSAVESAAA